MSISFIFLKILYCTKKKTFRDRGEKCRFPKQSVSKGIPRKDAECEFFDFVAYLTISRYEKKKKKTAVYFIINETLYNDCAGTSRLYKYLVMNYLQNARLCILSKIPRKVENEDAKSTWWSINPLILKFDFDPWQHTRSKHIQREIRKCIMSFGCPLNDLWTSFWYVCHRGWIRANDTNADLDLVSFFKLDHWHRIQTSISWPHDQVFFYVPFYAIITIDRSDV